MLAEYEEYMYAARRSRIENGRLCDVYDLTQTFTPEQHDAIQASIDQAEADLRLLSEHRPKRLAVTHDSGCRDVLQLPSIPMQASVKPSEFRNGYLDTEILEALASRIEAFQTGPTACTESRDAAVKIREAIELLRARVTRRKEQGIYGGQTETSDVSQEPAQPIDEPKKTRVRAIIHQGNIA